MQQQSLPQPTGTGRPALFVDLDGTVRRTVSGHVHPLTPADQLVLPGVAERLRLYRDRGYAVIGVTNQGGVAFDVFDEADVEEINRWLSERLLPDLFVDILYCPHHPEGWRPGYSRACEGRKPRPGMARTAAQRHGLDLSRSIMVGDLETDREFAVVAGIATFYWAHQFFASSRAD